MSQWLHAPSVEYLIPSLIATVAACAFAWRVHPGPRAWAIAGALALVIGAVIAIPAQRDLVRVEHDWEAYRRDAAVQGIAELRRALDHATASAVDAATTALHASRDRAQAFDDLAPLAAAAPERGVMLMRGDSTFAWAGRMRVPIDATHDGVSVVATSFYLALQYVAQRGDTRVAVLTLLGALPPADRLAAALANDVADRTGMSRFAFGAPSDAPLDRESLDFQVNGRALFDVRAEPLVQGEVEQRIAEHARARAGIAFVVALVCFIIGVWRETRNLSRRIAALAVGLACTALVPLNQYSNLTRLFDPALYFTRRGGPLTGNAGALATTSALVLLGILAVFRRRARPASRWGAILTVLLVAGLGPFLLTDIARGVQTPAHGVDASLWLIWEIPLFLAAVSVLLAGAAAGAAVLGPRRGVPPWVAPAAAAIVAMLGPVVWDAPGRWPWWYTILWIIAIAMLAFSRRTRLVILSASTVAALGAATLVWGRTARGRVEAAERDLAGLSQTDSAAVVLVQRFGTLLSADEAPTTRQALLASYVLSDLAAAGNPVALFAWPTDSAPSASFATADIPIPGAAVRDLVASARRTGHILVAAVPTDTAVDVVMAAPAPDSGVTAVVVAPRSRLFTPDPFARLLGLDADAETEPPYTVRFRDVASTTVGVRVSWRREASELHGDWVVRTGLGAKPVHVEVELRPLYALIERGALIVLLDLAIVGLLWIASVVADGGAGRWFRARRRRWARSYRARLSLALFLFFVVPASAFAIWSYGNLAGDATQSRALVVNETLRALDTPPTTPLWLPAESDRLDTPLFLYRGGELAETSDPLYTELAPIGRVLPPGVAMTLAVREEQSTVEVEPIDGSTTLFGYREFQRPHVPNMVVAVPARADELAPGRRRRDLGVLVAFATALGALGAFWLSGVAARQLARPIGTLREAALAIAGGALTPPLEREPTVEFYPVFTAFRQMAADLHASRAALEQAQRRTAAVLRNVASGVVAVDPDGRVALANPRAEALLDTSLIPGTNFDDAAPAVIARPVAAFLVSPRDEEEFEGSLDQRQFRATLTRLSRGGAVLTIDDVSELARAQRVLAWGEMARQVAHEIKNPLTPIRLGVQHLRRARADARVDFDRVLDQNVNQILGEIDRLDEIARSFSRYGAAPDERPHAAVVDVAAIVRAVVALERMGAQTDLAWAEHGVDAPVLAMARTDELKEVLLNVLENARHAGASRVDVGVSRDGPRVLVEVRDDGAGIAADVLPRIFEPHFSTRTSGSGLGLAISRRLVEGWGGEIDVSSAVGQGTSVRIHLRAAA